MKRALDPAMRALRSIVPISVKRYLRQKLRLEPFQVVMRKLRRRNISLEDLDALEVFGYTGEYHTRLYAPKVKSLEVWEIGNEYEASLRQNLPNAAVKITDSYSEIRLTERKFDLIVIDNPIPVVMGHCEHFDLFPDLFKITAKRAILIIDVFPEADMEDILSIPGLFNEEHLRLRGGFYHAEDPAHLRFDEITEAYRKQCSENGYNLIWHFYQRRTSVYYFVCYIESHTS